jgi:hypothetical protein
LGIADTKTAGYAWYNLANAYGYSDARKERDDLAKEMTPEMIALGQERTRELQKVLTEAGVK